MPALHGRVLQSRDYEPGAPPVFVLRYKTWKQRFNGDLPILNKSFVLNGTARTLIGIMPPRFGWYDADLYIPEKLAGGAGMGAVGLILVTVGVYSALAYSTARRTQEIGIRMALGARPANVLGMVIGSGLRLVLFGIAIGVAISLLLGRFIGTQLIGVTAYDPVTLGATTFLLTLTAAFACWIPARRAARVDPIIALRYE